MGKIDPQVANLALMLLQYDEVQDMALACKLNEYPCWVRGSWFDAFLSHTNSASESVSVSLHTGSFILRVGTSYRQIARESVADFIRKHT